MPACTGEPYRSLISLLRARISRILNAYNTSRNVFSGQDLLLMYMILSFGHLTIYFINNRDIGKQPVRVASQRPHCYPYVYLESGSDRSPSRS